MSKVQQAKATLVQVVREALDETLAEITKDMDGLIDGVMSEMFKESRGLRPTSALDFEPDAAMNHTSQLTKYIDDTAPVLTRKRKPVSRMNSRSDSAYLAYVRTHPNCRGEDVNKALGITGSQASAIRARLGKQIVRKGKKRGATYSIRGGK